MEILFTPHDYIATTPGITPELRGATEEQVAKFGPEELANLMRVANEFGGLIQGDLQGYSVIYQKDSDAYSEESEATRDWLVDMAGKAAGFDVDGMLTIDEQKNAAVVLSDEDREHLGIDSPEGDVVSSTYCTFRSVAFGSLASRSDWQITEIEVPNTFIRRDGTQEQRHLRILNIVPIASE